MLGGHLDWQMRTAIHVYCVCGARKQKRAQRALLSESISPCRSYSRRNILIAQGKKKSQATQWSTCMSIPTLSEPTAGFRAPSAVLCSNEGLLGENWEMMSAYHLRAAGPAVQNVEKRERGAVKTGSAQKLKKGSPSRLA